MERRIISWTLVDDALAEANLVNGGDGFRVLDDYRPKFSGETCFALVSNTIGEACCLLVQLAFQLQASDSTWGDIAADDLASSTQVDGPVMYFPGWTLKI